MTRENGPHPDERPHGDTHDDACARWEAYRDGDVNDADARAFEAELTDEEQARLFARESAWLKLLGETEPFDDEEAFTRRVLAAWEAQPSEPPVAGRIGGRRMAVIGLAWAALLALAVGLTQTSLWQPHDPIEPSPAAQGTVPVSALVQHANREYDQQAMRMVRVLEQPQELIDLDRFFVMFIDPVAMGAADDSSETAPPPAHHLQPAPLSPGRIE